jgi:hypothetical protein
MPAEEYKPLPMSAHRMAPSQVGRLAARRRYRPLAREQVELIQVRRESPAIAAPAVHKEARANERAGVPVAFWPTLVWQRGPAADRERGRGKLHWRRIRGSRRWRERHRRRGGRRRGGRRRGGGKRGTVGRFGSALDRHRLVFGAVKQTKLRPLPPVWCELRVRGCVREAMSDSVEGSS